MNILGERLNRGLSVVQAAEAIGVSRELLRNAENGAMPQPRNAKKIADFYGCSVTDIWPVEPVAEAEAAA